MTSAMICRLFLLSLCYCKVPIENAALNNLSRWMRHNKLLMAALEGVGYYKYRHSFTPKEVRLIFRYMGEPGE